MPKRPLILLSNDDGHHAKGLRTLAVALRQRADVVICAPETEQSTTSHSLTLTRPLRLRPVDEGVFAVDGTPADCVYVALNAGTRVYRECPISWFPGMNHGLNLGADVFYSGTVAAAREAALRGIPAMAASADGGADRGRSCGRLRARLPWLCFPSCRVAPSGGPAPLVNVNVPPGSAWLIRSTRLGLRVYDDVVEFRHDPRGREYLWLGGGGVRHERQAGSDTEAHDRGEVSVTPLSSRPDRVGRCHAHRTVGRGRGEGSRRDEGFDGKTEKHRGEVFPQTHTRPRRPDAARRFGKTNARSPAGRRAGHQRGHAGLREGAHSQCPGFSRPGVLFKDITPLLADPKGFHIVIDSLAERFIGEHIDAIVGIESRGFIFGSALAARLNASFVPVRKTGRLPAAVDRVSYDLEYGTAELEMHKHSLHEGAKVLVVDDLLATGGTARPPRSSFAAKGATWRRLRSCSSSISWRDASDSCPSPWSRCCTTLDAASRSTQARLWHADEEGSRPNAAYRQRHRETA